ncbi:MAG: ATP-binding protein, partial [Chloroflexi bacterium]|nr:ATP-binding protein [Chloroflexota bacterium]
WQLPRETVLAVPLPFPPGRHKLTWPGIICLVDPAESCPLTLNNIEPLAIQVTTFLDRAFLRQRSDQQAIEFGIVSDISYSITSTLHLEEIFRQVADAVRRALGAESISIGLTDDTSGEIIFVDALMGPLFNNLPPIRLQPGQGIAGWVATKGEPLIVNNVYADQRFYSKVDHDSGYQTHSILCVPLLVEQRVIGVLEAINKQNGHFDENDLRLLQAISGPLAVAIENARLHADVLAEKRRIETIFASMSEGLLTINKDGWVTAANDALLTLLRAESDTLYGQRVLDVIQTQPASFDGFWQQVLEVEDEYPQLACDLRQDGDECVPVLISGTTTRDAEGEVDEVVFVFSDLRQIREVERMRDDFFHNIIHELRTPLATILMYARLLREGKARDDSAKADRFLGVIERESDRLQKMVRQMLQLAKLEAREIQRSSEPVNLIPIFDQMLPPLADQATEKGLLFSRRIQTNLPPVLGNEDTLYMIFKNLIENSIKFTPSGSVRVDARQENGQICIEVSDDGIGIPEQAMPNLFKRFYRAQTAVERGIAGTGLGLYMVKEGIEKHGGTIDVASAEGKGTTFTVRLPVANL